MSTDFCAKCPICLYIVADDEDTKLSCKHDIHLTCAEQLRNNECPVCRAEITTSESRLTIEEVEMIQQRRKADIRSFNYSFFDSDDSEGDQYGVEDLSYSVEDLNSLYPFFIGSDPRNFRIYFEEPELPISVETVPWRQTHEQVRGEYMGIFGELTVTHCYFRRGSISNLRLDCRRLEINTPMTSFLLNGPIQEGLCSRLLNYSCRHYSYIGFLAATLYTTTDVTTVDNFSMRERMAWFSSRVEDSFLYYRDIDQMEDEKNVSCFSLKSKKLSRKITPRVKKLKCNRAPSYRYPGKKPIRYKSSGCKDRPHYQRRF